MNTKTARQSNIELLRIFAAIGVVFVHLNNEKLGGIIPVADKFGLCQFILMFLRVFAITGVNTFILITGYFQANKKSSDLFKPLRLIIDLLIFLAIFFTGYQIMTGGNYSFEAFVYNFIPSNWFILVYSGLYILSPFINKLWNALKNKEKITLVTTAFLLYSVYPLLFDFLLIRGLTTYGLDGDQGGYNIVNFVLLYIIGCSLRDIDKNKDEAKAAAAKILHVSEKSIKSSILPLLIIVDVGLVLMIAYFGAILSGRHPYSSTVFYYNNPLVIILTVLLFLSFKSLNIPCNKVINYIARSTFYVYIIHLHLIRLFKVSSVTTDDTLSLICYIFTMTLMIFVTSFVCFAVYDLTFGKLLNIISKKWKKRRYIEVE